MTCDYPEVRVGDENAKADVESGIYTKHYQIKPTDTVLDIGAHVGYFSMWAASRCKRVFAFEPEPYNFKRLSENTKSFPNVECFERAATHIGEGMIYLHIDNQNSGGHSLFRHLCNAVRVKAINVGSFLKGREIMPDFAKIDAEAAEFNILKSFQDVSLKFPMAIEMHDTVLFRACHYILKEQGYTVIPEEPFVGVCYALP